MSQTLVRAMELSSVDELAAYTLSRGDDQFVHQYIVDARGASENLVFAKPIRIFFSLTGLYLLVEHGYSGRQIQAAHLEMARAKLDWPIFKAPHFDLSSWPDRIMQQCAGAERDNAINAWCKSVWACWSDEHERVRAHTDALLVDFYPLAAKHRNAHK